MLSEIYYLLHFSPFPHAIWTPFRLRGHYLFWEQQQQKESTRRWRQGDLCADVLCLDDCAMLRMRVMNTGEPGSGSLQGPDFSSSFYIDGLKIYPLPSSPEENFIKTLGSEGKDELSTYHRF